MRIIKRLHLLILRSFIGPFFAVFFIVLIVLLMQFLWRYIDELVGKGLDFMILAEFLYYTTITLVPMALPISILMASLMTFGNLGENYELTAIKSSGISLQRIMRPLIFVAFILSLSTFAFANNVLPYANLKMRTLLYDIRNLKPELQIVPGEFVSLADKFSIRVADKDKKGTLYNVLIYDHRNESGTFDTEKKGRSSQRGKINRSVIIADSATLKTTTDEKKMIFTMFHGKAYHEMEDFNNYREKDKNYPHRYDSFKEQKIIIDLSSMNIPRSDQGLFKSHYSMMNLEQLEKIVDSLYDDISIRQAKTKKELIKSGLYKTSSNISFNRADKINKFNERTPICSPDDLGNVYKSTVLSVFSDDLFKSNIVPKRLNKIDSVKRQDLKFQITDNKPNIKGTAKSQKNKDVDKQKITIIDIDSVFQILTLEEKTKVSKKAIEYANIAKNIVDNSSNNLDNRNEKLRRYEIEWHRKFTISFSCIIFLFIGAPLGAIIRKGGLGLPLVISVIFFILHYVFSLIGEKVVRESLLPAYQGMWISSSIFFIAGVFVTYQAAADSSIFNVDSYINFLKKIFGQRYNVVDKLNIRTDIEHKSVTNIENILDSLLSLDEAIDHLIVQIDSNLKISEFISAIYTFQADSNLILFDRYYNNTFRAIINHPTFNKKSVRAKLYDFPAFTSSDYKDIRWKLTLRIVLVCTILLIPIVMIRQYLKIVLIKNKLLKIKKMLPELMAMIKINDIEP